MQIDYIDYELESEDSIYEISENETDNEIDSEIDESNDWRRYKNNNKGRIFKWWRNGTKNKFDSNIFDEIKGKELDLSVEKIFKIPTIKIFLLGKKMNIM